MIRVEAAEARVRRAVGIPRERVARPEPDLRQRRDQGVDELVEVGFGREGLPVGEHGVDRLLVERDLHHVLPARDPHGQLRVAPRRRERGRARQEHDDIGALEVCEQLLRPLRSGRDAVLLVLVTEHGRVPARREQVAQTGFRLDVLGRVADEDGELIGRARPSSRHDRHREVVRGLAAGSK